MDAKFAELSQKFSQLRVNPTVSDSTKDQIYEWLKELNHIEYGSPSLDNNTRGVLLIIQLCNLIPPYETYLVSEASMVIEKLVRFKRAFFKSNSLILTIEWYLSALCSIDVLRTDRHQIRKILEGLDVTIQYNTESMQDVLKQVAEMMEKHFFIFIKSNETNLNLMVPVVKCLKNLSNITPTEEKGVSMIVLHICDVFIRQLTYVDHDTRLTKMSIHEELQRDKIWSMSICGLRSLLEKYQKIMIPDRIQILLGIAKAFIIYKLSNIKFLKPAILMPTAITIPESKLTKPKVKTGFGAGKKRNKRKNKHAPKSLASENPIELPSQSMKPFAGGISPFQSAAEISDLSDTDNENTKKFQIEGIVRDEALQLLRSILDLCPKNTILSYFIDFMPHGAEMEGKHNLSASYLKDPSPRRRIAALKCLSTMLVTAKTLLSHAEYRPGARVAFIPLSVTTAGIIEHLHRSLCLAFNDESPIVLAQVLKCTSTLVQSSPYHRLKPGLTVKLIRNLKLLLAHQDTKVHVGALIVLTWILSSQPIATGTMEAMLRANIPTSFTEAAVLKNEEEDSASTAAGTNTASASIFHPAGSLPWILDHCLTNLTEPSVAAPVKLESLQVLAVICQQHFEVLILPYLADVSKGILAAYTEKRYMDVLYHAGKTTESMGEAMNKFFHLPGCHAQSLTFWQSLLDFHILALLQSDYAMLRAVGADCIASIGENAFDLLPKGQQLLCMTTLLSLASDEDTAVKGAGVRAIAIILLYPAVRVDMGYMFDAIDIVIQAMHDQVPIVRIKASWSLGNLAEALVQNFYDPEVDCGDIAVELTHLIRTAIQGTHDTDKVKCNAVRALGNFLQLLDDSIDNAGIMIEAIHALINSATSGGIMKVRWNACYALRNIMNMPLTYRLDFAEAGWRNRRHVASAIFDALTDLIEGFRNLKVRINAALAIMTCSKRDYYATDFIRVWSSVLVGLYSADNVDDFNEFYHRDNLSEQLCLTLTHLLNLCRVEDLVPMQDVVTAYDGDVHINAKMQRVRGRYYPEKDSSLLYVDKHFTYLLSLGLNEDQMLAFKKLSRVFITPACYDKILPN